MVLMFYLLLIILKRCFWRCRHAVNNLDQNAVIGRSGSIAARKNIIVLGGG